MKKILIHSLILTLALGTAVTVFAEENATAEVNASATVNTGAPKQPRPIPEPRNPRTMELKMKLASSSEKRDELKDRREDLKAKMASTSEKREEMREKMASSSEKRQEKREDRKELIKEKIENRFKKMFLRFQATIDRETGIMAKINQRIAKVKEAGGTPTLAEKNTSDAKMHLDEAQKSLDLLRATATSTKTLESEANASSTAPGQVSKETMQKLKNISDEIEKHLKEAHKALEQAVKNLRGMSQANATTTTSVNVNSTTTGSN